MIGIRLVSVTAVLACSAIVAAQAPSPAGATTNDVSNALASVRGHTFHPVDGKSFTIDRDLKQHGIADLDDADWKVRTLAVRDLVHAGDDAIPQIAAGLQEPNVQVRYVCAMALGILKAKDAIPALEKVVRDDADALARSQAAIALGQIESTGSLELLRERMANDSSRDVQHQCELSIDQIQKKMGATDELRAAYASLDPGKFEAVRVGEAAPDFTLPHTEGSAWSLRDAKGQWVALVWVFADWCPVCQGEFRELIEMREEFAEAGVHVATIEAHDRYRARVMVGKEIDPKYWFAKESFQKTYAEQIWWPHLIDRAGAVGAIYGVDPLAFAVHAEYINRPSTILIDPEGIVRFAYYGTFWGDRPSIKETLNMIQSRDFSYENPKRRKAPQTSSKERER